MPKNLKYKKRGAPITFRRPDANTIVQQLPPAPPRESWWVGLDRESFNQKLKEQHARIEASSFGKGRMLITPPSGVSR